MSDWKQMDLEELTSSAGDTRVSHSVTPGSDEARKMTVISGQKLKGSWLPYGPVGDCLRTLLDTSAWASTKCYLTWKQKATPGSRLLFQLAPLMPHTDATGYGLLHTPTATANQMAPSMNSGYRLWPTPTTTEAKSDTLNVQNRVDKNKQIMLCHAVRLWPTPTAHLSKEGGVSSRIHAEHSNSDSSGDHIRGDAAFKWPLEPNVGRVANGIPRRVDRLKGLGNAVVPQIPEIIGNAILETENV